MRRSWRHRPPVGPPCHTDTQLSGKKKCCNAPLLVALTVSPGNAGLWPLQASEKSRGRKPVGRPSSSIFPWGRIWPSLGSGMGWGWGNPLLPLCWGRAASTCSEAPATSHLKVMLVHHDKLHRAFPGGRLLFGGLSVSSFCPKAPAWSIGPGWQLFLPPSRGEQPVPPAATSSFDRGAFRRAKRERWTGR